MAIEPSFVRVRHHAHRVRNRITRRHCIISCLLFLKSVLGIALVKATEVALADPVIFHVGVALALATAIAAAFKVLERVE